MVVAQSVEFKMRDAVFGKQPLKSVCNVIGVEVWNPAFYLFKYCFWKLNEPVTSIALRRFNHPIAVIILHHRVTYVYRVIRCVRNVQSADFAAAKRTKSREQNRYI